jgi:hypothetical protein
MADEVERIARRIIRFFQTTPTAILLRQQANGEIQAMMRRETAKLSNRDAQRVAFLVAKDGVEKVLRNESLPKELLANARKALDRTNENLERLRPS